MNINSSKQAIFIFTIFTVTLFTVFSVVPLAYEPLRNFQLDSEALVKNVIKVSIQIESEPYSGFMAVDTPPASLEPYYSQFGLQARVFSFLAIKLKQFGILSFSAFDTYISALKAAMTLCFAGTLSLFLLACRREFGLIPALFCLLLTSLSPWIIAFSSNLYWVIFIVFMPFSLTWFSYMFLRQSGRISTLYLLIGIISLAKCLCGYEYITNFILSPVVPMLYYELKLGSRIRRVSFIALLLVMSGCTGFFTAFGIHLAALTARLGSFQQSVGVVMSRATARTTGLLAVKGASSIDPFFQETVTKFDSTTANFLLFIEAQRRNLTASLFSPLPFISNLELTFILVITVLTLWLTIRRKRTKLAKNLRICFVTLVTAFLISTSWGIFGWSHHYFHWHINSITYYLPFYLSSYVLVPFAILQLTSRQSGKDSLSEEN